MKTNKCSIFQAPIIQIQRNISAWTITFVFFCSMMSCIQIVQTNQATISGQRKNKIGPKMILERLQVIKASLNKMNVV